MVFRTREVAVEQLPAKVNARVEKRFLRELEDSLNTERPTIVLDCSVIREMDSAAMHLLLCCLECAMKRNGDVRLCGVLPRARLNLELAGIDRLFRIFPTAEKAVQGFLRRVAVMPEPVELEIASESAA